MQDLYQTIRQYTGRGACLMATILNGEDIGAKVFFCDKKLIWKTEGLQLSRGHLERLRDIGESGLYEAGPMKIFAERFGGRDRLVICGAGHVSMPVIRIGKMVGFHVTVLEDRPEFAAHAESAGADAVVCGPFEEGLRQIPEGGSVYFVIVTRGHRYDLLCLKEILKKRSAYVGMMGSRKRVAAAKEQLKGEGVRQEALERLHAPIGIPIGAETPEEIGVSIMAQIIQCRGEKEQTEGYREEILDALDLADPEVPQAVLAQIVWRKGSAPRKIGTKMVIASDGRLTGTIGGGCVEAEIIRAARQMCAEEGVDHLVREVDLTSEGAEGEGMVCGGKQLIYLEKIIRKD